MNAVIEVPHRYVISAEEYQRMGEAGVFAPEARLELIEGEIIEMAPIGSPHAGVVNLLNRLLGRRVGERALVAVQNPAIISERSVPQPDLALLAPRDDAYARCHPTPAEILLLIEVADSSLRFDVNVKLPLYARSGIAEVWVIDVNRRLIRAFREPGPNGYATALTCSEDDSVECLSLPGVRVNVRELFPG